MCSSYQTDNQILGITQFSKVPSPFSYLSPAGVPLSLAGPVQIVDSPLLRQQVEAQRLGIKHLKNENNRLKVHYCLYFYTAVLCQLSKAW